MCDEEKKTSDLRRVQSKRSEVADADGHKWDARLLQLVLQLLLFARYLDIDSLLRSVRKRQVGWCKELDSGFFHVADQLLLLCKAFVADEGTWDDQLW